MLTLRKADSRGHLKTDWIESRRTFSNNSYHDLRYVRYQNLKVINDDILQPGNKVPWHEHQRMEILGYIVEGEATHTDSLGNDIRAESGFVQLMSCGKSIWHSEANDGDKPIRYIQIWVLPETGDPKTVYQQLYLPPQKNGFGVIAGPNGPLKIKTRDTISSGIFTEPSFHNSALKSYLYVIRGSGKVQGVDVSEGDGLSIEAEGRIEIIPSEPMEAFIYQNFCPAR